MRPLWAALLLATAVAVGFLPAVPVFWVTLACYAGIGAIVALGLVVLTGFGNMTSFGQAGLMGFGAYTSAVLTTQWGVSPWLALPADLLVAGAAALLIGAVTVRLSGHYLALGTIAWSVSLFYLFSNLALLGRNDGLRGIPPLSVGGWLLLDARGYFVVVCLALGLALLLTRNLLDSRVGRTIRSLRGGSAAAASAGVSIAGARLLAFVYAGLLAGLAGWLYAHLQRSVNPSPFGLSAGIEYLLMAVVGGPAHMAGALLGAGLVTVANDQLQNWLPILLGQGGSYESIVFGGLLVLVLQWAPAGLWPLLAPRRSAPTGMPRRASQRALASRPLPSGPVLAAAGLRRVFGGLVAVDDIDLQVSAGEIVGLIGPNGAGKSTTFALITGVLPPSSGELRFLGRAIPRMSPQLAARLGIARTFQHVKLVQEMSVLENVALGAHLRGRAGAVAALLRLDRAEEASLFAEAWRQLERLGLAEVAWRPAGELALGLQRLVEIARALCLDPVLLLLDEPAAGLRHQEKADLAALLRTLREAGMAILLVEHDIGFVMALTDRLVVMDFGTRLAEGTASEVRHNPAVIEAYLGGVG